MALPQQDTQLFNSLVMELDMASMHTQLGSMGLNQGSKRNSFGASSTTSNDSYMGEEDFEGFLMAVLQEELADQAAAAFLGEQQ
jgi:hypothetical protein